MSQKLRPKRLIFLIRLVCITLALFLLLLIPILLGLNRSLSKQFENFKVATSATQLEKLQDSREPRIIYMDTKLMRSRRVIGTDVMRFDHIDKDGQQQYMITNSFFGTPEERTKKIEGSIIIISSAIAVIDIIILPTSFILLKRSVLKREEE